MINGAHVIIYSTDAEKDRAILRDVLKLPSVDVGDGWLIFGLPPAEVAVHPSTKNDVHEFYLMCADIKAFTDAMRGRGVDCGPLEDQGWGILSQMKLPGGGKLGVYQPRHARPPTVGGSKGGKAKVGTTKVGKAKGGKAKGGKAKGGKAKGGKAMGGKAKARRGR
jgi:hypothetical protein